jgi:ribose 5-phosphate isomerase RpiB
MLQTFLNTAFVGGRHVRRVEKIAVIEQDDRKKN